MNSPELDEIVVAPPTVTPQGTAELAMESIFAERFLVLEQIGSGGMGQVYKVRHIALGTLMALKILNNPSIEAVHRFIQEAKLISRLRHPNIVAVHDFGGTDRQVYLAMDFLPGDTLAQVLKTEKTLDCQRFQRLFLQICGALAHAHENGIIHRDIKPANVIITSSGDDDEQAIVVDFGVAKVVQAEVGESLTQTGSIIGTPTYMSPEQLQGMTLDARTDIYSLGCVMYEALVGQPPYSGIDVIATLFSHLNDVPKPFPKHLCKAAAGRRLEAITLRCLAKLPNDRYQNILELAADLKKIDRDSDGLWQGVNAIWQANQARRNCARKTASDSRYGLAAAGVMAGAVSFLLCWMPPQITEVANNAQANAEILACSDSLMKQIKHADSSDVLPVLLKAKNTMDGVLDRYPSSQNKKQLIYSFERNCGLIYKRMNELAKLCIAGRFLEAQPVLQKCLTAWGSVTESQLQLRQVCVSELTLQTQRFQFLCWSFVAACLAGITAELTIFALLVRILYLRFNKRA
jgi:serine/threonine protein kinase